MTMRTTKKSLALSVLSMLICVAMLIGSTFAWFTDNVTTGKNKITAGNLDVKLMVEENGEWVEANADTSLFDKDILWEPGAVLNSKPFKVVNGGNLALRYMLSVNIFDETFTPDGLSLTDVIKAAVLDDAIGADRAGLEKVKDEITAYTDEGILNKKEETDAKVMVLYWAPQENEEDNKYNLKDGALSIDFGINVFATQAPVEEDSINEKYDDIANIDYITDIKATVKDGVVEVNENMVGYAELVDAVNECEYDVYMYDGTVSIRQVYFDIADGLYEKLNEQHSNIYSIAIEAEGKGSQGSAKRVTNGELIERATINDAIADALNSLGVDKYAVADKTISELDGYSITVTVTDIAGNPVDYKFNFDLR